MAEGDVTVGIFNLDADLETNIQAMRNGASDTWLMTSTGAENQQILIVNIEGQ